MKNVFGMLQVILLAAKLLGYASISWWEVFIPLYVYIAAIAISASLTLIIMYMDERR